MSELPIESSINESVKETKYDAPQGVNQSGSCSKSGCSEEDSVLVHCEDGKIIVTKETVLGETE